MFSKACEYGIKATIFIAQNSAIGMRVNLKAIASAIDSPEAFTAKILQLLAKSDIISSEKGPLGGFKINDVNLKTLTLSSIVDAIDGDKIYRGCALGLHICNEQKPCPLHEKFKLVRDDLKIMLESTYLSELANNLEDGHTFLKR